MASNNMDTDNPLFKRQMSRFGRQLNTTIPKTVASADYMADRQKMLELKRLSDKKRKVTLYIQQNPGVTQRDAYIAVFGNKEGSSDPLSMEKFTKDFESMFGETFGGKRGTNKRRRMTKRRRTNKRRMTKRSRR
jgi:hypothetical protein